MIDPEVRRVAETAALRAAARTLGLHPQVAQDLADRTLLRTHPDGRTVEGAHDAIRALQEGRQLPADPALAARPSARFTIPGDGGNLGEPLNSPRTVDPYTELQRSKATQLWLREQGLLTEPPIDGTVRKLPAARREKRTYTP